LDFYIDRIFSLIDEMKTLPTIIEEINVWRSLKD